MSRNKNWKNIKLIAFFGICLLSLLFEFLAYESKFLEKIDLDLYDYKLTQVNSDKEPHEDIIIVSIDEPSLDALENVVGRWPWQRQVWEDFLNFLGDAGARTIYFDVKFSEYTRPPKDGELDPGDLALFLGTQNFPRTVHAVQVVNEPEYEDNYHTLNLPLSEEAKFLALPNDSGISANNKLFLPYDELMAVTAYMGAIDVFPDSDGVYRRIDILRSYGDHYFKTLALAPYIDRNDEFTYTPQKLTFKNVEIPLEDGKVLVNIYENFKNYSASGIFSTITQIQNGKEDNFFVSPKLFEGKDIFIGATAVGLDDVKNTAFGIKPGVFLHASLLNSIKTGEFISKFPFSLSMLVTLVMLLIITWAIIFQDDILYKIIAFLLVNYVYFAGAKAALDTDQYWLPSGYILSTTVFGAFLAFIYRTFYENRDKRFLKTAFKNYISPDLIDEIHETGELPKLGGDIAFRTAYFTDIAGFSSFSEKIEPEELVNLINEYLTEMTDVLLSESGTLDKFVGDAIIACFGAPLPLEDHGVRAARVGIKMQKKLRDLRAKWAGDGERWPAEVQKMKMRIGINSGMLLTGNMGAQGRMNYTMMGDAVNLAARLEASGKYYGVLIHISQSARDQLNESFLIRKLDRIVVKGKTQPVVTYELLGFRGEREDLIPLVDLFEKGLSLYENKKFKEAKALFEQSLEYEDKRFDDIELEISPSRVYIIRCEEYIKAPPADDWDGINVLESK